jgi:hypothetical protein
MNMFFNQSHGCMYTRLMICLVNVILMQLITTSAFSQNWSTATLNEGKNNMSTGSIGPYVFFFSGDRRVGNTRYLVNQIEMIDTHTGVKQITTLPNDSIRSRVTSVSYGSKIYFAGGTGNLNGGSGLNPTFYSKKVDIYDTLTGLWSAQYLSEARVTLAAGAANGKVLFGGGEKKTSSTGPSNVVDYYSAETNTWTAGTFLPIQGVVQRIRLTGVSFQKKIYFVGGLTTSVSKDLINVYDTETNTWRRDTLKEAKFNLKSFAYKDAVYFGGGQINLSDTPADTIEIYRPASDSWEYIQIPHFFKKVQDGKERIYKDVVQAGCKAFFIPFPDESGWIPNKPQFSSADSVAVYDLARKTWSYIDLPSKNIGVTAVAAQNKIYFAGGADSATAVYSDIIDILTLEPKLQLAIANTAVTTYDFGTVETGDLSTINVALSNEGDYDLLFKDLTQRISISGDVDDFTLDPGTLQLTDTLEPAEIITLPVSFHPTTTGTKQITIIIQSNDPNTPAYSLTVTGTAMDTPTSILNPSEQNIVVYPNPTTGILHIDTQQQGTLNLQVLNVQGQAVKKETLTDDNAYLDVSALPDGFYIVKITGEKSSAVVKVLKK